MCMYDLKLEGGCPYPILVGQSAYTKDSNEGSTCMVKVGEGKATYQSLSKGMS